MGLDLGTIRASVGVDISNLDKGLMQAELKLATADKTITSFGHKLTAASTQMMMAGGLMVGAVAGVAIAAVKMASEFETSMRNVNSISKLSEDEFKKLGESVVGISKKFPQSAKELADGLYDIASSGFQGADGLKVLEAAASAASAGLTNTATSAKGITAVLNAYSLGAEDAGAISDTMFRTVDKGVITFEELSSQIGEVVGTANIAGIGFNELSGMIAYMTTKGINAAEATTALNRMMLSIITPTEELAAVLKDAGYESGQMALEQIGLTGVMELIEKAANGDVAAINAMSGDMRAFKAVASLTGSGIEELNGFMKDFQDTTGATAIALKEQSKSLEFQLSILKNNATALGIELGQKLITPIANLVKKLNELSPETKNAIYDYGELALKVIAAGGGVLLLAGAVGKLNLLWKSNPVGMVLAAYVALSGAIDLGAGKLEKTNTVWGELSGALLRTITPLTAIKKGYTEYIEVTKAMADGTISWRDGIHLNIFTMDEELKKIKELRIAQEDIARFQSTAGAKGIWDITQATKEVTLATDAWTAAARSAELFIKNYSDELPIASAAMATLIQNLNDGTISSGAFAIGVDNLRTSTQNGSKDIEDNSKFINNNADMQELAKIKVDAHAQAQTELQGKVVFATDAIEEQVLTEEEAKAAAEKLKTEIDNLNAALESGAISPAVYGQALKDMGFTLDDIEGSFERIVNAAFMLFDSNVAAEKAIKSVDEALIAYNKALNATTGTTTANSEAAQAWLAGNKDYQIAVAKSSELEAKINQLRADGKGETSACLTAEKQLETQRGKLNELTNAAAAATNSYTSSGKQSAAQIEATKIAGEELAASIKNELIVVQYDYIASLNSTDGQTDASIAKQKELQGQYLEDGLQAVKLKAISVESFTAMADGFDLSSKDIIAYADKMGIELDIVTRQRIIKADINYEPVSSGSAKMDSLITDATRPRTVNINADINDATSKIEHVARMLSDIDGRSASTTITTWHLDKFGFAMGGIVGMASGGVVGMPQAASGMVVPQTGRAIPIMAHEGEMILNDSQQGNLIQALWGVANGKNTVSKSSSNEVILHNVINLDGKVLWESNEKYDIRAAGVRV